MRLVKLRPAAFICFIPVLLFISVACQKKTARATPTGMKTETLYAAAGEGDIEQMQLILATGAGLNARYTSQLKTPLHHAVEENQMAALELLAAAGAQIDAKDRIGMTPLYYAATYDRMAMANFLISRGADVNAEAKYGSIALHSAAAEGNTDMVALLIARGADVMATNALGDTPLHSAVEHEYIDIAKILLSENVDINAKDHKTGATPLHYTAFNGDKQLMELLIAHGAALDIEDDEGRTALEVAEEKGHAQIVALLLEQTKAFTN